MSCYRSILELGFVEHLADVVAGVEGAKQSIRVVLVRILLVLYQILLVARQLNDNG